jgi:hypothetical protein
MHLAQHIGAKLGIADIASDDRANEPRSASTVYAIGIGMLPYRGEQTDTSQYTPLVAA